MLEQTKILKRTLKLMSNLGPYNVTSEKNCVGQKYSLAVISRLLSFEEKTVLEYFLKDVTIVEHKDFTGIKLF